MTLWIAFLLGAWVGCFAGVCAMCLMLAAKRGDE